MIIIDNLNFLKLILFSAVGYSVHCQSDNGRGLWSIFSTGVGPSRVHDCARVDGLLAASDRSAMYDGCSESIAIIPRPATVASSFGRLRRLRAMQRDVTRSSPASVYRSLSNVRNILSSARHARPLCIRLYLNFLSYVSHRLSIFTPF